MGKIEIKEYKLGDVSNNIQTGPFGSQLHQSDYSEDGIPVIMPKDFANGIISIDSIARVSAEHVNRLKQHKVRSGDIIYSRRGDVGRCALITSDNDGWLCGTGCIKVELNQNLANPSYTFYRLYNQDTFNWVQQHAVGAIMLNINTSIVSEIPIKLPPLPVQRKIAAVLTALDDKIALNKRINDKLEAMAKRLYDYWFVQFDFPDENGRPYKSSGGKMVWNETLKREIPEGWEVKRLGDVLSILKDGTHNPPKRLSTGIPLLTGTMFGNNFLNYENATYISKCDYDIIHTTYQPQANDLIITKIGTLGNVNILRKQDIPIAIHCNSALIRFPNNYGISFPFYFLKSNLFLRRLKSVKGQSIQEFASLESISTINMEIPNQTTINLFNSKVNSMLEHEEQLYNEIFYLTALRERLLPLLMNGQVEVK